jgi:Tfp pilus assembly protein PilF
MKALNSGDLATASQGIRAALAADPHHGKAHLAAGRLALRQGDLDAARGHLEEATATGQRGDRCVAWINLGRIEMQEENPAAGRQAFERALRILPGEPQAYVDLARWYVFQGPPDSARAVLDRGLTRAFPPKPVEDALAAYSRGEPF